MAMRLENAVATLACDTIVDSLDAGAGAATISIYSGSQVTNVGDSEATSPLAVLTMGDPAFGGATNGAASASPITSDTNADNSGTAGHAVFKDSNSAVKFDCTCGESSADILFDDSAIVAGGTVAITSMTVTVAGS